MIVTRANDFLSLLDDGVPVEKCGPPWSDALEDEGRLREAAALRWALREGKWPAADAERVDRAIDSFIGVTPGEWRYVWGPEQFFSKNPSVPHCCLLPDAFVEGMTQDINWNTSGRYYDSLSAAWAAFLARAAAGGELPC
jgi:hypothetical protein